MIIDMHHHALPKRALDLVAGDDVYRVQVNGRSWHGGNHVDFEIKPEFTDTDAKLASLDRLGFDAAIVSVMPPLFYYELDEGPAVALCDAVNHGLREMAAEAPGRLWWMADVPLQHPARAIEMLEEAAQAGAVGVEIGTSVAGRRLDEAEFDDFWSAAARLRLPVQIHPDVTYDRIQALAPYYLSNILGFPFETTLTIVRLIAAGVLDRHPELRVVLMHGGGFFPYQAGRLRHGRLVRPELAQTPRDPWEYFGQITVDGLTHDAQALAYLISRVGVDNVGLGTDLPFDMAPSDPLGQAEAAVPDAHDRAMFLGENARRLYRLAPE
jgi:aminocarboxymuconate-semialdehyde decarboxylase